MYLIIKQFPPVLRFCLPLLMAATALSGNGLFAQTYEAVPPPAGSFLFECAEPEAAAYSAPSGSGPEGTPAYPCADSTKMRYIRVAYHFMLNSNGTGNFTETGDGLGGSYNGYQHAEAVINHANYELTHNAPQWRTFGPPLPVKKRNIQYVLVGVYFHRNTTYATVYQYGSVALLSSKYGVDKANTLNVFSVSDYTNTGDAGISQFPALSGITTSLALTMCTRTTYALFPGPGGWQRTFEAGLLNHEIGHNLDIHHTWNEPSDLSGTVCDDTPPGFLVGGVYSQCWEWSANPASPCNIWANISNNMMDYNAYFPHASTPCQIIRANDALSYKVYNYIHSCGSCAPANAFFTLKRVAGYIPKMVAHASFGENQYKVDVYEVAYIGSNTSVGGYFSTGWIAGQAGEVDFTGSNGLGQYYPFQLGKFYRIELSVSNGCNSHSTVKYYGSRVELPCPNCQTVGDPVFSIGLSPNPTSDVLNIEHFSENPGRLSVEIRDFQGTVVSTPRAGTWVEGGSYDVVVEVSQLPAGYYYVVASFNDDVETVTFIKQ